MIASRAVALVCALAAAPLSAAESGPSPFQPIAGPDPDALSMFYGIAGTGPRDVWAVGEAWLQSDEQVIRHWDGRQWKRVRPPRPAAFGASARFGRDGLRAVTVVSAEDAWAVGGASVEGQDSPFQLPPLIEHWDGKRWSVAFPAQPDDQAKSGILYSVSAVSKRDVWAVGQRVTMHWDGASWSRVPIPASIPMFTNYYGVSGAAADDVWAVGSGPAIHWDGQAWSVADPAIGDFSAVAALTKNDVWAVGGEIVMGAARANAMQVRHWDGTSWTRIDSPALDRSGLSIIRPMGLSVVSPQDIWVTGAIQTSLYTNGVQPFIEHWDGKAWTVVQLPETGMLSSRLNGIAAFAPGPGSSPTEVFACGFGSAEGIASSSTPNSFPASSQPGAAFGWMNQETLILIPR